MTSFPFEQLHIKCGIIQPLTEKDHDSDTLFRVQWKDGLMLELSYRWDYYWISVEKDDSTFQSIRLNKEAYVMEKLQKTIVSIERNNFARRKSTAELVAEIIQKRQLTGCMNNTKWDVFRSAMTSEMPFPPPYEIKTLFDEDDSFITRFIRSDATYCGFYDEEEFVNFNYKVIEYLVLKTRYCDVSGGRLVTHKTWHDATSEFIELMQKYHIPYTPCENADDTFIIYGYRNYTLNKRGNN